MPGAIIMAVLCARQALQKNTGARIAVFLNKKDAIALAFLTILGITIWLFAERHIRLYMDEAFSAVHCAEDHPFHTLAYYMLPNNHILFNLVNNVLFGGSGHPVFTGRLISGVCFLALLYLLYGWLRQLTGHRVLAICIVLTLALQYPVWGFSGMARGYSMCLLCEWAAFIFLMQHFRSADSRWLLPYALASTAGFATIPTFLYLHLALTATAIVYQTYHKNFDLKFWKTEAAIVVTVFLFYLPALCFSGVGAFTANDYVTGLAPTGAVYLPDFLTRFNNALQSAFTGNIQGTRPVYLVIYLLPLVLFYTGRRNGTVWLAVAYVLLWALFAGCCLIMRRNPYARLLNGHFSISLALAIIAIRDLVRRVSAVSKFPKMATPLLGCLLAALGFHFYAYGKNHLAESLYHFDINEYGRLLELDLRDLPQGATVGFSDESFYLFYVARHRGFSVSRCASGSDDYYIKTDAEALPAGSEGSYQFLFSRGDYGIYKRASSLNAP